MPNRLHVTVLNGSRLPTKSRSDVFCVLTLDNDKWKTRVRRGTASPEWNEDHAFAVKDPNTAFLLIQVKNKGRLGNDDPIGKPVAIRMNTIVRGKPLLVKAPVGEGLLTLTLTAIDFGSEPEPSVNYDEYDARPARQVHVYRHAVGGLLALVRASDIIFNYSLENLV